MLGLFIALFLLLRQCSETQYTLEELDKMAKKAKGKRWYTVVAPKMFGKVEIGKTITDDPEKLMGRKISVSLMTLLNDFRKYYMKFTFRVISIDGEQATTEFDGSKCVRDYISRMVRRRSRRVDTIQDLVTKDGVKKPVLDTVSPIQDNRGNNIGSVVVFQDISERREAEETLQRNEKELKKKVKELEDFYDIAIGRELRIIELKKEIDRLEIELKKYKSFQKEAEKSLNVIE